MSAVDKIVWHPSLRSYYDHTLRFTARKSPVFRVSGISCHVFFEFFYGGADDAIGRHFGGSRFHLEQPPFFRGRYETPQPFGRGSQVLKNRDFSDGGNGRLRSQQIG